MATLTKSLVGKILIDRQWPRTDEVMDAAAQKVADLIAAPRKAIRDGWIRDGLAVRRYQRASGLGRWGAARDLARSLYQQGIGKELIVNSGGFIASKIGDATAIPGLGLALDWAGARATRASLDAAEAAAKAAKVIKRQKTIPDKIKAIPKAAETFKRNFNINNEIVPDTTGWGIGNAAAEALSRAGVNIPFKGAAVALAVNPRVSATAEEALKGRKPGESTVAFLRRLGDRFKKGGDKMSWEEANKILRRNHKKIKEDVIFSKFYIIAKFNKTLRKLSLLN